MSANFQHQQMHLMGINLSTSCASRPEMLGQNLFRNVYCNKAVDFALVACRISNWAYLLKYQLKDK